MAVTLEEMAMAYINFVKQEIQKAEEALQQNQQYLAKLQEHLRECEEKVSPQGQSNVQLNQNPMEGATQTEVQNPDGSVTKKVELPNPFEQLQNS